MLREGALTLKQLRDQQRWTWPRMRPTTKSLKASCH